MDSDDQMAVGEICKKSITENEVPNAQMGTVYRIIDTKTKQNMKV